jgi:ABC-type transport system substrate-binding protein
MTQVKEMSLNKFAKSLGFTLSGAKSWLLEPEFAKHVKVIRKGKRTYYLVTNPEKAKEALKSAGYYLPEDSNA